MVVFHIPVTCPWCGHKHIRYVQQTMPLYRGTWQVRNVNRCPPAKDGCGRNILVAVKPLTVTLEGKAKPACPDVDLEEFADTVEEVYFDEHGLARYNIRGTMIRLQADMRVLKYEKSLDTWFETDKHRFMELLEVEAR